MDAAPHRPSEVSIELPYTPPYAWASIREFLAARAIPGVETVEGDRYRRTIAIEGLKGILEVAPTYGKPALTTVIRSAVAGSNQSARLVDDVVRRVRRLFDLDTATEPIEAHLARSPLLESMVAAQCGLRVPGAWEGFELGIRAILGQQITVVGARRLAGRVVARFGEPLPRALQERELTTIFPDADRIARADLDGLGVPGARARAVVALGVATVEDPDLFARGEDLEAALARLRALPGVGEWSAQYIALRAMGERDAFPASDVGLLRAATRPGAARPSPAALLAQAEAWRPWRAYAAQHLWTSLFDPR